MIPSEVCKEKALTEQLGSSQGFATSLSGPFLLERAWPASNSLSAWCCVFSCMVCGLWP